MTPAPAVLSSTAALPWYANPEPDAPPPATSLTTLEHCLLLAALLHVWLVLVLGSAPAGTAQPGRGVWGAINVTLRGPAEGPAAVVPPPPTPVPVLPGGPSGQAPSARWGGAVREQRAPEPEPPGAARLGTWAEQARVTSEPLPLATPAVAPPDLPAAVAPAGPPPPPPGRVLQERSAAPLPAAAAPLEPLPPAERAAPVAEVAPIVEAVPVIQAAPVVQAAPVTVPVLRQLGTLAPATPAARVSPLARPEPLAAPPALPSLAAPAAAVASPRAPDAGVQLGHDVATAPSVAASSPRLNLELPRLRGGELSRTGSTGVLPVLPRPPELPDKLGREIEKAAKADCRNAYGGLGVLAVVPLAVDAVRKDGCKW